MTSPRIAYWQWHIDHLALLMQRTNYSYAISRLLAMMLYLVRQLVWKQELALMELMQQQHLNALGSLSLHYPLQACESLRRL